MTDGIFSDRFFGATPAWHKIGYVTDVPMGGVEALTKGLGGGHYLEMRPASLLLNGQQTESGMYYIVRVATPDDPTDRIFGHTTERYSPIQTYDLMQLFDEKVGQPVDSAGFLGKGERMFVTWKLPMAQIRPNDEVQYYGFLGAGFDGKMGIHLYVVSIRVVCSNTWTIAVSEATSKKAKEQEDRGVIFSGKHIQKDLMYLLGEWMGHVQSNAQKRVDLANNFFKRLVETPIKSDSQVERVLQDAFPVKSYIGFCPDTLRERENGRVDAKNELHTRYRDGIKQLFSGAGTEITPDMWGLFNAGTEYFNHVQVEKKPAGLSVVDGNRADNMNKLANAIKKNL